MRILCLRSRRLVELALILTSAWMIAGCKPKSPGPSTNGSPPSQSALPTSEQSKPSVPTVRVPQPGDDAWQDVVNSMREPDFPTHWQTNTPTPEELAVFEKQTGDIATNVAEKARAFYTKYPEHPNASEAKQQEYQLLSLAAQLGNTNSAARVDELEQAQLKDPSLSQDDRLEIRLQQLQRSVLANRGRTGELSVAQLESGARALQKDFPGRPEVQTLLISAAQGWLEKGEIEKSRALVHELQTNAAPPLKEAVGELSKKLELLGKPISIKFSDLDGKAIDLASLRGKVVLIDFWATWCRPCVAEMPKVKTAYEKLHPKGFQIIGISLDTDNQALTDFLKKQQIAWPQCFGEPSNKLAESFGITGIPAMWLVDKKGLLRDLNARHDLAAKVERMLAEVE